MSDTYSVNRPFKEAVCIDAMRIFDSCSSQDCLEDLVFSFEAADQTDINNASYIKAKAITVPSVGFVVDAVPFNKGFYTVDVTYNFRAEIEVYPVGGGTPSLVYGTSSFAKKVILYGSDGSTSRFVSGEVPETPAVSPVSGCACCSCDICTLPVATVSIAPPMCLDASLDPPAAGETDSTITITIGIFAIIQLARPVPLMIPAYDYCMPEKECAANTDSPCELFDKISFPASEFFPQGLDDPSGNCQCGNEQTPQPSASAQNTASANSQSSQPRNTGR
ncbi:MAG: hypothetical protein J6M17_04330 [Ruminococcus sp.]|nr:hypothetical protein [Ruminococcus sp.]